MATSNANSSVQLSLFSCQRTSVKDGNNGRNAKLSTYMKSREALWRLIATYPQDMPVAEAILRARVDFTKCRKEVAA